MPHGRLTTESHVLYRIVLVTSPWEVYVAGGVRNICVTNPNSRYLQSLLAEPTTTSVSKLLSKIVECMVLKGTFGVMPSDDHLERLDKIIQCE
jgi:hypothetical protein